MEALTGLRSWEKFYFAVTGNHIYDDFQDFKDIPEDRKKSVTTFMRKRPGKICWVDLAEAAYRCGEEIFDQLSEKMKSPEGTSIVLVRYTTTMIKFLLGVSLSEPPSNWYMYICIVYFVCSCILVSLTDQPRKNINGLYLERN